MTLDDCFQVEQNVAEQWKDVLDEDWHQKWPRKSEQRYKWKLWVWSRAGSGLAMRSF